jgi:hypothetical protein
LKRTLYIWLFGASSCCAFNPTQSPPRNHPTQSNTNTNVAPPFFWFSFFNVTIHLEDQLLTSLTTSQNTDAAAAAKVSQMTTRAQTFAVKIVTRSRSEKALVNGVRYSLGDGLMKKPKQKPKKTKQKPRVVPMTPERRQLISRLREAATPMLFDKVNPEYTAALKAAMAHTATQYFANTGTVLDLKRSPQPFFDIIYDRCTDLTFARIVQPRTIKSFPNYEFKIGDVVSASNQVTGNIYKELCSLNTRPQ